MLRQIWQWLKGFLGQLFGSKRTKTSSGKGGSLNQGVRGKSQNSPTQLTDTDYEFLFSQLLEGVAHGWHEGRILKFFERLGEQGKQKQWVDWLRRFGDKVLASPAPNHQLGARMVRLGEMSQPFPYTRQVGQISLEIGRQLLARNTSSPVWEYEGPDVEEISTLNPPVPEEVPASGSASSTSGGEEVKTITLDQLLVNLQQNANLVEQMAQQLGIETTDPHKIIEALRVQFNALKTEAKPQKTPDTAEGWFNLGLQQAKAGDLESAIANWDKALELNPDLSPAWHNRGSALSTLGRLEEAIASFERAIAIRPDDDQSWNNRGNALYNLQRWEDAIASWDKVIEIRSDYYQAWYNRGCALENLERWEESIASYDKALEIKPDFEPAKSRRNYLLENRSGTSD